MTAIELATGIVGVAPVRARATSVDDVFVRLGPAVQGYLRSSGVEDSDDALGEVFLRVARALPRFDGDSDDLRRWVFTIAYHCAADELRRQGRHRTLLGRIGRGERRDVAAAPPPSEPFDTTLLAALRQLTADQREVVTLRFVADLAVDDVATLTGRTAGAVKSLQHRALRNLAAALAPDGGDA